MLRLECLFVCWSDRWSSLSSSNVVLRLLRCLCKRKNFLAMFLIDCDVFSYFLDFLNVLDVFFFSRGHFLNVFGILWVFRLFQDVFQMSNLVNQKHGESTSIIRLRTFPPVRCGCENVTHDLWGNNLDCRSIPSHDINDVWMDAMDVIATSLKDNGATNFMNGAFLLGFHHHTYPRRH